MQLFFTSLYTDIRALPRSVFILVLGQFLNRCGTYVYPFLALYLTALNYTAGQVATVIAVMGVGNILGPIAGGYLADAIGRQRTIVISLFGSALGTLGIYASVTHYPVLLVTCFANGFLSFMFGPAASALLTDLVPSERRLTAYAMVRLAINGGFAAGPTIGGILYISAPWLIFIGDAFTTLVFAVLAFVYLPHGIRSIQGKAGSIHVFLKSWKQALRDLATHNLYKQYLIAIFFMSLGFCQVFSVLALSTKGNGLTPSQYGMIMSLNGLLILLIELPITHWLKQFAPKRVLAAGFVLIGIGLLAFGFAENVTGYIAAMVVFTLGEIVALPVGMAYSSDLAPEKFRGRYLGLRGITWGLAGCVASGGLIIYDHLGASVWFIAGISSIVAAPLICLPARISRRRAIALNL